MNRLFIGLVVIAAVVIYAIISVIIVTRKRNEAKIKDVLTELSNEGDTETIHMKMSGPEQFIVDKFHIKNTQVRYFVWTMRIIAIAAACLTFIIFGFMGIAFCGALLIWSIMDTQLKNQIAATGVNRIDDTVSFINAFTPQISSGKAAKQAFLSYIQSLPTESHTRILLEEYVHARDIGDYHYVTPAHISEMTTIYENALYNEEKGVNDYLYIIEEAKQDLFQKSEYYNEYKTRCNEVLRPIEISYYIGIPVIFIALFGTFHDFWFTGVGLVAALLVLGLFLLFKLTINRLNINTLHKIM